MCEILCVTNRALCREDFLLRIEKIAQLKPAGILLREKELDEKEYRALAEKVMAICRRYQVPCILHGFVTAALDLQAAALHLPMPLLRQLGEKEKKHFSVLGASCHSVQEAKEAEKLGCRYITAGHIFDTDCKIGIPGRGLEFLTEVCQSVSIPVYAIGGVSPDMWGAIRKAGAAGGCVMSGAMTCENLTEFFARFQECENEIL